ncbi:hypothetical protein SAMN04515674_105339 [Pseudarcicella hirudinis]|uniref:HTH arsR-type domain-containing protein n=1 Tax=Pseudarcicella hirudinis TaxID=1079859 RepID=A0A1I5T3X8_9BACT|nr:hypothetical protein [Pseudarcicella hirudinis]SFP77206.1 hypothetical protein SAMN04515674_105339 [Pseudarcicella hirudinis]
MNLLNAHAEFYDAIGNPTRLLLLCVLMKVNHKKIFVTDLIYCTGISPRNITILGKCLENLNYLTVTRDQRYASWHLTEHFITIFAPIIKPLLNSPEVEECLLRLKEREEKGEMVYEKYSEYLKTKKNSKTFGY